MSELDYIKTIAEFVKQGIDNNPNYSEWEKWWRKCGIEQTEELAKEFYKQQQNPYSK